MFLSFLTFLLIFVGLILEIEKGKKIRVCVLVGAAAVLSESVS